MASAMATTVVFVEGGAAVRRAVAWWISMRNGFPYSRPVHV